MRTSGREFSPSSRDILSMEASRRDKLVKSIEQDHYQEFRGAQTSSLSPPEQRMHYESSKHDHQEMRIKPSPNMVPLPSSTFNDREMP